MNNLAKPLIELNDWLAQKAIHLDLTIIGAFAIYLHGIQIRMTMDIDTLEEIGNKEISNQIQLIGSKYGLPYWLNNQAQGLILPHGFFERTISHDGFSHIKIKYASRHDLILLKVAAYYYRQEYETKDLEDLINLKASRDEILNGIDFLKQYHLPDNKKFKQEFIKTIESFRDQLLEEVAKK